MIAAAKSYIYKIAIKINKLSTITYSVNDTKKNTSTPTV
jgi:hypothetical protein